MLQYCWEINKCKLLHNQVAVYSAGSPLVWREVEGGELPTPRHGLRATVVGESIYVTGGYDGRNYLTSVLWWKPAGETWQEVGNLTVGRGYTPPWPSPPPSWPVDNTSLQTKQ